MTRDPETNMADTREPVNSGQPLDGRDNCHAGQVRREPIRARGVVSACSLIAPMGDPDTIRRFLASNEFSEVCTADMPTADSAYHYWLDPKYDQEQRKKWLAEHRNPIIERMNK